MFVQHVYTTAITEVWEFLRGSNPSLLRQSRVEPGRDRKDSLEDSAAFLVL